MKSHAVIDLIDVGKKYGRRQLFSGITLKMEPGSCTAVTGPNGSGKSTLLKIIAGLVRPSAGIARIYAEGRYLVDEERTACIGMVSPEIALYQTLTGYENLHFMARSRGMDVGPERLLECLGITGLAGRHNDMVGTYSTGMRQRLKLAILAALRPPVWLLDEPSSNLDVTGKALVNQLIEDALERQAALVIATNEPEEAGYATQKIALV